MKTPRVLEVDGFLLPPTSDPKIFRDATTYVPEKGRVVVASYPKCGTTWTLQIVMLILRKGVPPKDSEEYFSLLPFMEMTPLNILNNLPKEACIKTHLPFHKITFSSEVKYIYVARHPADCVLSYYHHVRFFPIYFYSDGTFDEFFEVFISGNIDYGDYFDNLLTWYERRNEPNVCFITYESLKADPKGMILKIAKFISDEIYEDLIRDDEKILKMVMEYSSIDYMKHTVDKFWESFAASPPKKAQEVNPVLKNYAELALKANKEGHFSIGNFIRRGVVGGGKIALSEDQKMRLESLKREKCGHSNMMSLWKDR